MSVKQRRHEIFHEIVGQLSIDVITIEVHYDYVVVKLRGTVLKINVLELPLRPTFNDVLIALGAAYRKAAASGFRTKPGLDDGAQSHNGSIKVLATTATSSI